MGIIKKLHPGKDGLVRVATVLTSDQNKLKRPTSKLCRLAVKHTPFVQQQQYSLPPKAKIGVNNKIPVRQSARIAAYQTNLAVNTDEKNSEKVKHNMKRKSKYAISLYILAISMFSLINSCTSNVDIMPLPGHGIYIAHVRTFTKGNISYSSKYRFKYHKRH